MLLEYLHSYGMVLCFSLTMFALFESLDLRLVRYSDPHARCAAVALCHRCIKHVEAPCGLQRTFLLLIPATMVLCGMPFFADLLPVSYNTRIFGTFYTYAHPVLCQIFEIRYLPGAALLLLTIAWLALYFNPASGVWWSKIFFAAGSGALGFAFFRLVLLQIYRENLVWYAAWEEFTELLFVVSAGLVLWIFRQGLFFGPVTAQGIRPSWRNSGLDLPLRQALRPGHESRRLARRMLRFSAPAGTPPNARIPPACPA